MSKFLPQLFKRFSSDRRGATTVEYFVLLAFLALGGIAVVKGIQSNVKDVGDRLATGVKDLAPWQ